MLKEPINIDIVSGKCDLSSRPLYQADLDVVVNAIRNNHALTMLDLSNTNLKDDDIAILFSALKKNKHITQVDLSNNSFIINFEASSITKNTTIVTFKLNLTNFGKDFSLANKNVF